MTSAPLFRYTIQDLSFQLCRHLGLLKYSAAPASPNHGVWDSAASTHGLGMQGGYGDHRRSRHDPLHLGGTQKCIGSPSLR